MREQRGNIALVSTGAVLYLLLLLTVWWASLALLYGEGIARIDQAQSAGAKTLSLPAWVITPRPFDSQELSVALPTGFGNHDFIFIPRVDLSAEFIRIPEQHRSAPHLISDKRLTSPLITGHVIEQLGTSTNGGALQAGYANSSGAPLTVRLQSNDRGNALMSPVYVGALENLAPPVRLQHFLNIMMRQINMGAGAVLALLCMTFWFLHRRETAFLWLGLGLTAMIILNTGALAGVLPAAARISSMALSWVPLATLAAAFFAQYLTGIRVPTVIRLIGVLIPLLTLLLESLQLFDRRTTWLLLTLPATQLGLASAAVQLGRGNLVKVEWDQAAIGISFIGLMFTTAVDGLSRLALIESLTAISPVAFHICLLALGLHIIRKQHQLLLQTSELSAEKDAALRDQAAELKLESERSEALAKRNASLEEHQRLTSLLHSGVATNLSSIAVIQADAGLDPTIGLSARHGLFEVRLMADHALGRINVRETLEQYLDQVIVPTQSEPPRLTLDPRQANSLTADLNSTLELTRIVHEIALALRIAAKAEISHIEITSTDSALLVHLHLARGDDAQNSLGKSLTSAKIHARSVGSEIFLTPTEKSCRISLKIPQSSFGQSE